MVCTRRRFSDRLLLAHLARLDKLCGEAEVAEFADDFDATLARYAAGEDRPARPFDTSTGSALRVSGSAVGPCVPAEAGTSDGCSLRPEAPAFAGARAGLGLSSSGQWSRRSTPATLRQAQGERELVEPCPDCGDPDGAIEGEQLAAFEAGAAQWWRVIPSPEGADPAVWHYLDDDEEEDF